MMKSDTYEIHYTIRTAGEQKAAQMGIPPVPRQELYSKEHDHTMSFSVWQSQRDTKDEIHRIKAIARALAASDEFRNVSLVKKTEETEEVEFA